MTFLSKRIIDAKLLWRDWRGGQLNLIVTALLLAVMVVTAVSLLADRVERGLTNQISSFLAADLALRGRVPITQEYKDKAVSFGIETAEVAEFQSMVFVGDKNHLASLKVVQNNYPLRGGVELLQSVDSEQVITRSSGPNKGEVWVEPRLLNLIDAALGDTIEIGFAKLAITALIINEPDRGTGFTSSGARVLMSQQDLAQSKLVRPGSRVRYKLLMSGDEDSIQQYMEWYKVKHGLEKNAYRSLRQNAQRGVQDTQSDAQDAKNAEEVNRTQTEKLKVQDNRVLVQSHYRLITPESSEQRLGEALQRGRTFLLLSGMIGVLLAGLAIALASHRYAARLTDQVALMKAWGQSARDIRSSHFTRLLMIALIATLIGMVLGWLAHFSLMAVAKGLFAAQLPTAGWRPWFVASLTGVICMLGFALPALWHLPSIAPLRVLRRDIPTTLVNQSQRLIIGVVALLGLAFWYSGSLVLSLLFFAVLFVLFGVCAFISLQLLKAVQRFGHWKGSYVRLGLANLWRRRTQSMIQLLGFSVTLMLLLTVTGVRTNLIAEWQAQLPEDAPSHFIYNVGSAELEDVKTLFSKENVSAQRWFPMVLGRLVGVNGDTITRQRLNLSRGLSREVNFTQAGSLPTSNKIIEGQWWSDEDLNQDGLEFSMEQDVAQEIGFKIGDEVEFSIGGIPFIATLTSLRSVDWQSMNVNFYVIFKPGALDRFSPNWVTSVSAPLQINDGVLPAQAAFVPMMVKQFPTSVVLEVSTIIDRIRNVISRVTQGLELIMLLVLACGAMVLFASIAVSYDERIQESAILRTLGSSRKLILGALAVEYAVLGFIAGLLASVGAESVLFFVQVYVFELTPSFHPLLWLMGLGGGLVLITLLGLMRSKSLVTVPPLQSLKQITR